MALSQARCRLPCRFTGLAHAYSSAIRVCPHLALTSCANPAIVSRLAPKVGGGQARAGAAPRCWPLGAQGSCRAPQTWQTTMTLIGTRPRAPKLQ
jgi:hypothetical protein